MLYFADTVQFAATDGGTSLALLLSGMGGLSGLAALATVYITYRANQSRSKTEGKSVAITELEKAVPGLSEIIEQWQTVVHQLQTDLVECRGRLAELEREER